jgi:enoyl-CoA hydratase/carnithine racemase
VLFSRQRGYGQPNHTTPGNALDYQHIAYELDEGILTITLDRAEQLNAFTNTMMLEMIDAFDRADADDSVRAIIVTGRGRGFCAGADLSGGPSTFDANRGGRSTDISEYRDGGGRLTLRIFECKKPVIGAINGPAVGVGVTMTLAMDIRLASDQARFGFVFSRRGIVPEACSTWFLPRIVGIQQAAEWVYSGRVFNAQEALAGRLVRSVHPHADLLPAAREIAREIAQNTAPVSVALSRQMLWRGLVADHPMQAHMADSRGILVMGQSPDVREGVAAFLEKRAPKFTMSVSKELPDLFPWWEEPTFR